MTKVNGRDMTAHRPALGFTTRQPYCCLQHLGVHGFDTGLFEKAKRCQLKPTVQRVAPFFNKYFLLDGVALALFLCGHSVLENAQLFLRFLQLLEDDHILSWTTIREFKGHGTPLLETLQLKGGTMVSL